MRVVSLHSSIVTIYTRWWWRRRQQLLVNVYTVYYVYYNKDQVVLCSILYCIYVFWLYTLRVSFCFYNSFNLESKRFEEVYRRHEHYVRQRFRMTLILNDYSFQQYPFWGTSTRFLNPFTSTYIQITFPGLIWLTLHHLHINLSFEVKTTKVNHHNII